MAQLLKDGRMFHVKMGCEVSRQIKNEKVPSLKMENLPWMRKRKLMIHKSDTLTTLEVLNDIAD